MQSPVTVHSGQNALTTVSPDQIALRLAEYANLSAGAFSPNTLRAVRSDTAIFADWCAAQGFEFGPPAAPETVAAFVRAMAETRAPATIARYVASIDHLHRAAGVLPVGPSAQVKLALRTMRRMKGTAQDQANPMRWADIERAIAAMGDDLGGLRDAALLSVAYDTLCRASELVALNVSDISAGEAGASAYVAKSKTDQEGAGSYRFIAPETHRRVQAYIDARFLDGDAPLFAPVSHAALGERIAPGDVSRIYKRRVGAQFSAHSTRVGAAVEMRERGLETGDITQAGGWAGDAMPTRYTRSAAAQQSGAAKLARMQGRLG